MSESRHPVGGRPTANLISRSYPSPYLLASCALGGIASSAQLRENLRSHTKTVGLSQAHVNPLAYVIAASSIPLRFRMLYKMAQLRFRRRVYQLNQRRRNVAVEKFFIASELPNLAAFI